MTTTPDTIKLPGKPSAATIAEGDIMGDTGKSRYLVRQVAKQLGIVPVIPLPSGKPRRFYNRADAASIIRQLRLHTANQTVSA